MNETKEGIISPDPLSDRKDAFPISFFKRVKRRLPYYYDKLRLEVKLFLGVEIPIETEDRRILEQVIIPELLARPNCYKVLFVGCEWYTNHYKKFFRNKEYWTIEIEPRKRRFGAKNHVTDSIENLDRHFSPQYFDAIICNGVFGHGLNEKEVVERAFLACFQCLHEGGIFILGWNNVPECCPVAFEDCESLNRFTPYVFPPLATASYLTPGGYLNHTYNFYIRT